MYLQQLLNGIAYTVVGEGNPNVEYLSCDTSTVKPQCMFFCLKGKKHDGHDFFRKVVGDGAVALVVERVLPTKALQIVVQDVRSTMSVVAKNFYDNCVDKLKIVSIVGTNGKTSTSFILEAILTKAGYNTAVIGTNGIYFNGQRQESNLTTPDPLQMHFWFRQMYLNGVEVVIMEVSAHAIYLNKMQGVTSQVAIFTNLSQDHLDFFEDMQQYADVKKSFFQSEDVLNAVVNVDDELGNQISKLLPCITYSVVQNADVMANEVVCSQNGTSFEVYVNGLVAKVCSALAGKFNVYNILAAISCAVILGVDVDRAVQAVEEVKCISGRNETIMRSDGARIVVDFAHTPDGVRNILAFLRSTTKGKLIVVFGCGGNRDKFKRPLMAQEISKFADFALLTNDNPRFEDPKMIAQDVVEMLTCKHRVILNRSQATDYALSVATAEDTVAILGKGAEQYQEIRGKKFPYCDVEIVRGLLRAD